MSSISERLTILFCSFSICSKIVSLFSYFLSEVVNADEEDSSLFKNTVLSIPYRLICLAKFFLNSGCSLRPITVCKSLPYTLKSYISYRYGVKERLRIILYKSSIILSLESCSVKSRICLFG